MFSSERTASLISRHSPLSTRPATSLSNFSTDSSYVNGRGAWKILNLVLDHLAILQPHSDLGRHLAGMLFRVFVIWPHRHFLQELLNTGSRDAVRLELRRHHIAVKQCHREQVWQIVICQFLGPDELVHAVEATAGKIVGDSGHVGLDRNHLAGVELVLPGELDHAMDR
jgi:hypothetical protein